MRLLFLVGMSLIFTSCLKEKNLEKKELNIVSPSKIAGYDPIEASDLYMSNEIGKVYEGLYEFHPIKRPYELMPNLATKLPEVSADGLTYTFSIQHGVLFHDNKCFPNGKGRVVTAQDFVYSFKRLADPKLMSKGWWVFDEKISGLNEWREKYAKASQTNYSDEIEGLKAIDANTFQVKLKKPYPQFLYALAMPYSVVVPKEAVEFYGKQFLNHPVGTGPFVLPVYDQSNTIVYLKNPHYRTKYYPSDDPRFATLKVPQVDKITVHVMVESQPRWFSFQKAKLDLIGIPKDNYDQAIGADGQLKQELVDKGIKHEATPMLDVTFYAFNHEDPLFKHNVKLRQAMSMAYNRAEANKLFFNSTSMIAQGAIPPGLGGYDQNYKNPYVEYNLDKSKQLLKEAGYPGGKGLPEIVVQTTAETVSRQMLEFFTKSMAQIGIKIKMGINTWPELVNKVSKRQHQMYTMAWYADYPDAENFLSLLYCPNQSPGSNGANYCNPTFDALFKKATIMQDSPERSKLYQEMNEMVMNDVPWILGFHRTRHVLRHGWVQNYTDTEFTQTQFQYLGVDLELKKKLLDKF